MRRFLTVMASSRMPPKHRQFAPLRGDAGNSANAPRLQGVVFDVDGTLWYVARLLLFSVEVGCC